MQNSVVIFAWLGFAARFCCIISRFVRFGKIAERHASRRPQGLDRQAQVFHETINKCDLRAILHGRVHYTVSHVAIARATFDPAACTTTAFRRTVEAWQTIDLQNLDRFDILHRLDGFTDNLRQVLDKVFVNGAATGRFGTGVFGCIDRQCPLCIFFIAHRCGIGFGNFRQGTLFSCFFCGNRCSGHADMFPARLGFSVDLFNAPGAVCGFNIAGSVDLLFNFDKFFLGFRSLGLGIGFLNRLVDHRNQPFLVDNLHFLVALDLKFFDEFLRGDAQLIHLTPG